MLQQRIDDRFGVFSKVFSIAHWRTKPWPQRLRTAHRKQALLLCGDAASVPPWGTRTSPWARRGPPPKGKTSGKRQGSKVCGLIAYVPGAFFSQGQEGRRNSAASMALLRRGLAHLTHSSSLMQEGARSHPSAETNAFFTPQAPRLQVAQLPTYAPDSTPIEKLWKKSKQQETPLHSFPTFEALTEKVEQALLTFTNAPEAILALCSLPTALAKVA